MLNNYYIEHCMHRRDNRCLLIGSLALYRGADSGCEDLSKCDPLILARNNGHLECVQMLENHRKERTQRLTKEAEIVRPGDCTQH